MSDLPIPAVENNAVIEVVRVVDGVVPATQSKWYHWRKDGTALIRYLLDSEVHTFAFSVAANAILSFIPFTVLLYALAESVFHHSGLMKNVINDMVNYFLPSVTYEKDYSEPLGCRGYCSLAAWHSVFFADYDFDCLYGHLSAPGGGAQSGLGRD